MGTDSVGKSTAGFGLSFAVASIFNGVLVIAKETHEHLMSWMKSHFGHHWVTHGVIIISLFIIAGLILSRTDLNQKINAKTLSIIIIAATILGSGLVVGFCLEAFWG